MYDINPTLPLHGKLVEWGCSMASVISRYNFSLDFSLSFGGVRCLPAEGVSEGLSS